MKRGIWALAFSALLCASTMATAAEGPIPLTRVEAGYPKAAARPPFPEGTAKVRLLVGADGFVSDVTLLSEAPEGLGFGAEAVLAARRWTFQPGHPGDYTITMRFLPPENATLDIDSLPKAPEPITRVAPEYPDFQDDTNGYVKVAIDIAEDGHVNDAQVAVEMPPGKGFGDAALKAVKQWVFAPGQPGLYVVVVRFVIPGSDPEAVDWHDLPLLPDPVRRVEPKYPDAALKAGHTTGGDARLDVILLDDGSVGEAHIVDETPEDMGFGEAARNAILLWRFEPGQKGVFKIRLDIAPKH